MAWRRLLTPCTHVVKGGKHDLVGGHLETSPGRFLALSVKSKWGLFHARKVVFSLQLVRMLSAVQSNVV